MLTFCEKCGNIMSLKEKNGREGLYECRGCNAVALMKVERLVLTEKVFEEPSLKLVQKSMNFLI